MDWTVEIQRSDATKRCVGWDTHLMFQMSSYHGVRLRPPTCWLFNCLAINFAWRFDLNSTQPSVYFGPRSFFDLPSFSRRREKGRNRFGTENKRLYSLIEDKFDQSARTLQNIVEWEWHSSSSEFDWDKSHQVLVEFFSFSSFRPPTKIFPRFPFPSETKQSFIWLKKKKENSLFNQLEYRRTEIRSASFFGMTMETPMEEDK